MPIFKAITSRFIKFIKLFIWSITTIPFIAMLFAIYLFLNSIFFTLLDSNTILTSPPPNLLVCIVRLKPDSTRWRMGGEVKGKLANGVGSQYSHTTSERGVSSITTADVHTLAASSRLNWRLRRFKWTRPFRRKTKSVFCACAITFQTRYTTRSHWLTTHSPSIHYPDHPHIHTIYHILLDELTLQMKPLQTSKLHVTPNKQHW